MTLFEHPMAALFKTPLVGLEESYYQIVKKPMDLSTIKKKLKDNQYASVSEWKEDMLLVFDNSVLYNGAESIVGGLALYLKKIALKEMEKFKLMNRQNVVENVRALYREIYKTSQEIYGINLDKCPTPAYTSEQVLNLLSNQSEQKQMQTIIRKKGDTRVLKKAGDQLDIDKLSRYTTDALVCKYSL